VHKPTSDACAHLHGPQTSRMRRSEVSPTFHFSPHTLPYLFKRQMPIARTLLIWVIVLCLALLSAICTAQEPPGTGARNSANELQRGTPDVTIFVVPISGDTARVFLAFRTRVPHSRVKKEIGKLAANGWGVGRDLVIDDATIRPGDAQHAPVATGAQFSLFKAPQVQNNSPALLPYLQAFQDCDRVAVVFSVSDLKPYNGIENFDAGALLVRRIPEENVYHFEALIHDHRGRLPELTVESRSQSGAAPVAKRPAATKPSFIPMLPLMLILLGVGIIGGVVLYGWLANRASRAVPSRNARL
jgi:hypothetical protein